MTAADEKGAMGKHLAFCWSEGQMSEVMKKGVTAGRVCALCAEYYEAGRGGEVRKISMEGEGSLAKSGGH